MIGLLDTHAFIWMDSDPSKLSPVAVAFLQDPANVIYLSVVSVWEMQIKHALGKLALHLPLQTIVNQQQGNGLRLLTITLDHIYAVDRLPAAHRDPFDRMLVAQSNVEGAALITADSIFAQYPVSIVW